jgi:hypothetical protein
MRTVFLSIVTGGLLLLTASTQKETFVPANDVSFTVKSERATYKVGEQISLKYEIVNVSNAAVYVPREWDTQCPSTPHIWAWFESGTGEHFIPGYAGSCSQSPQTLRERMQKEAVLLRPRQRLEGRISMDTSLFGGLKPGAYRLEASLSGWRENDFTPVQQAELMKMGARLMRGEVPASTRIRLSP